ncbi:MAG: hypothetical protein NW224_26315 [Leptolyngbyaceae cyanobacterium bins.302]|nr:hypothetical protein [Leptolyngbyaceae cyanobacterium bins.302]
MLNLGVLMEVFLLWHVHVFNDGEADEKLIGVYSTREEAEAAIDRVKHQPGFVNVPEGFGISLYTLDEAHWIIYSKSLRMAALWAMLQFVASELNLCLVNLPN